MFRELLQRLRTWPSRQGWLETALVLVAFGATAYLLAPELFNFRRRPPLAELAAIAAVAFFLPAFFEELVFRGLLMPRYSTFWVLLSGALFVAWHPFEAWLFLHDARSTFYRPDFLALVGLFAIASTWVSWRTRSLWASVFLHWAVVVGWRACGGARFLV